MLKVDGDQEQKMAMDMIGGEVGESKSSQRDALFNLERSLQRITDKIYG